MNMLDWLKEKILGRSSLIVKKLGRNGEVIVIKARKISEETMCLSEIISNRALIERFDQDEQKWLAILASRYDRVIS